VNTTAARYQNLSINQTKLSGQCGRLKCCLNYELDTYMDALRVFPENADNLETIKGIAHLQKKDIFKNLMWYSFSDSSKQYPLTITRVKEIQQQNRQGIRPEELQPVELEALHADKPKVKVDVGFVNDVGQITLRSLERNSGKKRKGGNKPDGRSQGGSQQAAQQGNRGQRTDNRPQQGGGQQRPQLGGGQQRPQQQGGQQRPQQGGGQQRPQQQGGSRNQGQRQGAPQGEPRPQQAAGQNRSQSAGQQQRPQRPQGSRPQAGPQQRPPRPQSERPPQPPNEV
jgi:hypothetical protein